MTPSSRSDGRNGVSWSSLPVTATPCRAMMRAIAGEAGAADADEVHAAQLGGRQDLVGDRDPHARRPAASRIIRASFSSASSGIRSAAAAPIGPQPRRVGEQAGRRGRATHCGGQRGVVDQQRSAGLDDGAGVEGLLAVADRQRDEDRRQPHAGHLGDGVGARTRQSTASAAA